MTTLLIALYYFTLLLAAVAAFSLSEIRTHYAEGQENRGNALVRLVRLTAAALGILLLTWYLHDFLTNVGALIRSADPDTALTPLQEHVLSQNIYIVLFAYMMPAGLLWRELIRHTLYFIGQGRSQ